MTKHRSAFRAGLFIVCSIVLFVIVIVSIKGVGAFFDSKVQRRVQFNLTDDLAGLRVGDDVRLGGFKVGEIRSIEPAGVGEKPDGQPRLLVTFSLPKRIILHEDARLGMQSTLTGTAWLNIDSLGTGPVAGEGYAFVGKGNQISAIFSAMGETMPDIKGIASDVRNKTLPKVTEAAADASELVKVVKSKAEPITERAVDMLTQIRDFFGTSKGDWHDTIANLKATTASLKEKIPAMLDKADASLDKAKDALEDVKKTAVNARDASASVKDIIGRNKGRIDNIIAGVKGTTDHLKGAAAEIRRAPWRILYKPSKDEMNNLTLFDTTRQFSDGANELNDAATALRDAMQNPNLDPTEAQKLVDRLQKSFEKFGVVEEKLWKEAK